MLIQKRKEFDDAFKVPDAERLPGNGWIQSFCRGYNIAFQRLHGEAGSVDPAAAHAEQDRVCKILLDYAPRDRFNFDETGLYIFAPPDRGIAASQMRGKKSSKYRITIGLACNADGSEKLAPIFIGKPKAPRCFKKEGTPEANDIEYHNNASAWM
ncbi:hypothetical protein M378DRAFT_92908, partial [Amanita muscaria Koide BX008]